MKRQRLWFFVFIAMLAAVPDGTAPALARQAVASASEDRTPRVAIVLSSFSGSSDHDGTALPGLADPRPPGAELTGAQVEAMVLKAIELGNLRRGGLAGLVRRNDWVVIKLAPGSDVRVLRALLTYLAERTRGGRFTLADGGPCAALDPLTAEFGKRYPAVRFECADLTAAEKLQMPVPGVPLDSRGRDATYAVPEALLHCNRLISVAPLAMDARTGAALGIHNYRGFALSGANPPDEAAFDLFSFHAADYSILGGAAIASGEGKLVRHNLLLAGANAVAVDAVAAEILGFRPHQLRALRLAERRGFGTLDTDVIWTRGNTIEEAAPKLAKPPGWKPATMAYHVTANAAPGGDGTGERPWTLSRALTAAHIVKPGDTIWVRGGVYTGGFESRLVGDEDAPILVRGQPGERATIDARGAASGIAVGGKWTTLRDLEIIDSSPDRTRDRAHGLFVRGPHTSLINLVVRDCGVGIGFWSECEGPAEIYGCLIYNNGYQGAEPDRGHGHAIYTQNLAGVKRLVDNIMFNQFSYGIHAYGSAKAHIKGYHIEGNVAFNNGSLSRGRAMTSNILVGGSSPAEGIVVTRNHLYYDKPAASLRLGYGANDRDFEVRDNYIVGSVRARHWEKGIFANNTVLAEGAAVQCEDCAGWRPEGNTYAGLSGKPPGFRIRENDLDFAAWRKAVSGEGTSRLESGPPRGVRVFVRPNRYERGRAHVIVFNWDKAATVEADLSGVLKPGDRFEVRHAQNYFGQPVAAGTFANQRVRLPMTGLQPAAPAGDVPSPPVPTGPLFDVFVVRLK